MTITRTIVISVIVLLTGLSYLAIRHDEQEYERCIKHGGAWVKTDTVTSYVYAGSAYYPYTYDTHACMCSRTDVKQ